MDEADRRIVTSAELLRELGRPVRSLDGRSMFSDE